MGNAWSKHVGEWYEANKGKDGINHLSDAMRSAKCKADFRANNGSPANGPSMKTEKKKNEKKAKKGTRKMRGGSTLGSPANFSADSAVPTDPVASESKMNTPLTPVMKGGKSKRYSLKELMKFIEKNVGMVKGGSKGKMIKGGFGSKVLEMNWTGKLSFLAGLGGSSDFKPDELIKHLQKEISDKMQYHHMVSHIKGYTGDMAKPDASEKYKPFTTFTDDSTSDPEFSKYDAKSQAMIRAFYEYDEAMSKVEGIDSSNPTTYENIEDVKNITEALIASAQIYKLELEGKTIAGGNKQNVIVAFTKTGSDYTNVIHKKQSDPQFNEALTALTKTA